MKIMKVFAFGMFAVALAACSGIDAQTTDSGPVGCVHQMYNICWDPPAQTATNIVPTLGNYNAAPLTNTDVIGPLGVYGFEVGLVYYTGTRQCVNFSSDGYLSDCFDIVDGTFGHAHGGSVDGTYCPTDGYIISGSFLTETTAQGNFQYIPACSVVSSGNFTAFLVP
jgi:hypothetical protein